LNITPFILSKKTSEPLRQFISEYGERRLRSHKTYFENPKNWFAWTAKSGQELIGFTAYKPDKKEMDSFTVTKRTCRELGLGEALLKQKVNHAKSIGNQRYITTIGASNVPSINLVTKIGFQLVRAEQRDYGPILVFELELNR